MSHALAILVALLSATPALAAEQWMSRQLGRTTYVEGRDVDGTRWSGNSRQVGSTRYSDFRSDGGKTQHCQTHTLGSQTTTICR